MAKVGNYISFKKKTNKSSRNYKIEQIANYNLMNNYDYKLYVDIVKNNMDTNSRVELEKLKQDIESGIIDKVVVISLSNINRNHFILLDFMKFLKDNACELESIKEGRLYLDDYDRIILKQNEILEEENVR